MFKLYKAQRQKVDILKESVLTQPLTLLTGEVGSGKTYMGAAVAKWFTQNHHDDQLLIIVPKHVTSKWNDVLAEADVDMTNVKVVTTFNKDIINASDFIIYDEIHTMKTKKKHFIDYIAKGKSTLGLTGTIIDKSVNDITDLTNIFSSEGKYFERFTDNRSLFQTKERYVRLYIEPLLTVGISRDDIEEMASTDDDKVIINTHELSIDMTVEESAFYQFMSSRLAQQEISKNQRLVTLNNFLDRVPDANQFVQKQGTYYYIGEQLHTTRSRKDEKLANLLTNLTNDTLIYTLDDNVAKRVANDFNLTYIDTSKPDAVDKINETVKTGVAVFNISRILTGVDLHANNIIWYQTPESLAQEVQGVGRITRLSSSNDDKTVYYLYHNNTLQEDLVVTLRENHKINNEMINKVAKKSHVPFLVSE